jgi:hypothetical protein
VPSLASRPLLRAAALGRVIAFAIQQRNGTLVIGDPKGINNQDAGRVQNWRLRQWRRTHPVQAPTRRLARITQCRPDRATAA